MKKKILIFLTVLASLVCFAACNKNAAADIPAAPSQTETPAFPDNDFGKDNETTYPNAWN